MLTENYPVISGHIKKFPDLLLHKWAPHKELWRILLLKHNMQIDFLQHLHKRYLFWGPSDPKLLKVILAQKLITWAYRLRP